MFELGGFWPVLGTSVALFLVSAKFHGRQLRLERELAGYHHVVFGGKNPPFVEGLWHKDRIQYWSVFATLFAGSLISMYISSAWNFFILESLWTFAATFTIIGMTSFVRLEKSIGKSNPEQGWSRRAHVGSLGWWFSVVILSLLTVFLLSGNR